MCRGFNYRVLALAVSILAGVSGCKEGSEKLAASERMPDTVSYNFDIRPILSDKCFICHGPDANKRQAGLRLDIANEAYKALAENPTAHALVPGAPLKSEVFVRITSEDSAFRMPPVESNLSLTSREINLIEKWIQQGAEYEPHWAFVPPERPDLPAIGNS
ncbi:MAG: c-type cytochrome domain-containing protein, partial [Chryseosolibacter sp.]